MLSVPIGVGIRWQKPSVFAAWEQLERLPWMLADWQGGVATPVSPADSMGSETSSPVIRALNGHDYLLDTSDPSESARAVQSKASLAEDKDPQSPNYPPSAFPLIQQFRKDRAQAESTRIRVATVVSDLALEVKRLCTNLAVSAATTVVSGVVLRAVQGEGAEASVSNEIRKLVTSALVSHLLASGRTVAESLIRNQPTPAQAARSAYAAHVRISRDALERRPPDVQAAIQRLDVVVQRLMDKSRAEGTQAAEPALREFLDVRCFLMGLPYQSHATPGSHFDHPAKDQKRFHERVEDFVASYPVDIQESIRSYIQSNAAVGAVPALLHGPGGTGKTHFAEGVAGVLEVPLVRLEMQRGRYDHLYPPIGAGFPPHMPIGQASTEVPPATQHLGMLVKSMSELGIDNFVLFLDEADLRAVARFLKQKIQDERLEPMRIDQFDLTLHPKVRVIVATNDEPGDPALLSRMVVIPMMRASAQTKMDLADKEITAAAREAIDEHLMSEVDANRARAFAHQRIAEIIRQDTSPGVRESKAAARQVYHYIRNILLKERRLPTVPEVHQFIGESVAAAMRARERAEEKRKAGHEAFLRRAAIFSDNSEDDY